MAPSGVNDCALELTRPSGLLPAVPLDGSNRSSHNWCLKRNAKGGGERPTAMRKPPWRGWVAATSLVLIIGGCTKDSGGRSIASTSTCLFIAHFQGRDYVEGGARYAPLEGRPLGNAVVDGCNDTGSATAPPDYEVAVAELPGVSPAVALVVLGVHDRVLVVIWLSHLPEEVEECQ